MEMLHGRGCPVQGDRVLIPREIVAWSLENIERNAVIRSADGSKEVTLGQDKFLVHNGGSVPNFEDLETGQRRPARLQDLVDGTRVLDALPNIDVVIPLVGPQDVPEELMTIESFEAMLHHTHKPIGGAAVENPTEVRYMIELASACCGGKEAFRARPTIPILASPISPAYIHRKSDQRNPGNCRGWRNIFPLTCSDNGSKRSYHYGWSTCAATCRSSCQHCHRGFGLPRSVCGLLFPHQPNRYANRSILVGRARYGYGRCMRNTISPPKWIKV